MQTNKKNGRLCALLLYKLIGDEYIMPNRSKYFSYKMSYRPWYSGERYIRLNIAATQYAMKILSSEEFLIWFYCALLSVSTYYHFTIDEMRRWSGLSGAKVKTAITHFFELGFFKFSFAPSLYIFSATPVQSTYSGEKHHFNFNLYIEENVATTKKDAEYRVFNLDSIYEARAHLSPNAFKLWLELIFAYPKCQYSYTQAQEANINYNAALDELFKKSYLFYGENKTYSAYSFLRFGKIEEEQIEV